MVDIPLFLHVGSNLNQIIRMNLTKDNKVQKVVIFIYSMTVLLK